MVRIARTADTNRRLTHARRFVNRPIDNQHVIDIKALSSPRVIKTKLLITNQAAALVVETGEAHRRCLA